MACSIPLGLNYGSTLFLKSISVIYVLYLVQYIVENIYHTRVGHHRRCRLILCCLFVLLDLRENVDKIGFSKEDADLLVTLVKTLVVCYCNHDLLELL